MSAVSRRQFLVAAGAALGATSFLSACGGGAVTASECEGYDTLNETQLSQRESLGYVDQTPRAAQVCANCRFYNQPAEGAACGGCQLFAGPVAPQGWCTQWQPIA